MGQSFDFNGLFIFEMANNHQGQIEHGRRIIRQLAQIAKDNGIRAAIKFQFRQLDTFIHPAHVEQTDNRHIPRFLSTRLDKESFSVLTEEVRQTGLLTMCTPFDEESVDVITDLGIEVVKIGSPSAADWPLVKRVAECGKPVIFSTGGLSLREIDDLVRFFDRKGVHFAMMHCVSIYPTPADKLQLNQIEELNRRYPDKVIGYSTHENPDEVAPVQVAVAKGARILERHVGIATDDISLNAYSSTPATIGRWVKAVQEARSLCGDRERPQAPAEEVQALAELKRGVYAKRHLDVEAAVSRQDVYFAMPCLDGQLSSGEWTDGVMLLDGLQKDQPLMGNKVQIQQDHDHEVLSTATYTINQMLNDARIALPSEVTAEFSHHQGVGKFLKVGATIIECVNRSYCKKLLIQTPGQYHPPHYHKEKEETFQVLYGTLEAKVDGTKHTLAPGDSCLIPKGTWHEFWTDTGVIVEEISTTHFNDDSVYEDEAINSMGRQARKTPCDGRGPYQIRGARENRDGQMRRL
jgi:N-acetylneuraminate synthase